MSLDIVNCFDYDRYGDSSSFLLIPVVPYTLLESENERQKIEPVPIPLP